MNTIDLSYEASMMQTVLHQKSRKKSITKRALQKPWIAMIYDLVVGADYSYSRIAYRMGVSASTIQKLATNPKRTPRQRILLALSHLHHKVFQGQYVTLKARAYWLKKLSG